MKPAGQKADVKNEDSVTRVERGRGENMKRDRKMAKRFGNVHRFRTAGCNRSLVNLCRVLFIKRVISIKRDSCTLRMVSTKIYRYRFNRGDANQSV